MGGQLEYFGLWLSSEYGSGQSKARPKCTTYGSPCLAGKEEFRVAVLEAWGIGRPHLPDSDDEVVRDIINCMLTISSVNVIIIIINNNYYNFIYN